MIVYTIIRRKRITRLVWNGRQSRGAATATVTIIAAQQFTKNA